MDLDFSWVGDLAGKIWGWISIHPLYAKFLVGVLIFIGFAYGLSLIIRAVRK